MFKCFHEYIVLQHVIIVISLNEDAYKLPALPPTAVGVK